MFGVQRAIMPLDQKADIELLSIKFLRRTCENYHLKSEPSWYNTGWKPITHIFRNHFANNNSNSIVFYTNNHMMKIDFLHLYVHNEVEHVSFLFPSAIKLVNTDLYNLNRVQCKGRILGIIGQDPSASNSQQVTCFVPLGFLYQFEGVIPQIPLK